MQNNGLDGSLILKSASGGTLSTRYLTGWVNGSTMLELKDNNTTIAKYDYTAKTLYVMDNAFSQINYEFSINVN